MEKLQS